MTWLKEAEKKWKLFSQDGDQLGTYEADTDEEAVEKWLTDTMPQYYTVSQWMDETNSIYSTNGNKITISKDRGDKELTKYDAEWEELQKLISIISAEVGRKYFGQPEVSQDAIEKINSYVTTMPLNTVEDAAAMKSKLWNLASEVYDIPREWLIKRMEDKRYK